jgi:cell division protein FtsL
VRKYVTAFLVVLLPVLLCANVVQVFRYNRLEQALDSLEQRQAELIQENKRAILAISILASPDRIGEIAEDELDLEQIDPDQIIHLQPDPRGDGR